MGLFNRLREAVAKAAEAIQQRARDVIERAVNRSRGRDSLYKEETPSDSVSVDEEEYPEWVDSGDEFGAVEGRVEGDEFKSLSEKLKEEDLKQREKVLDEAYNKFNKEWYDGDLSRETYDNMWNTIGEFTNDYGEEYGSENLIVLYEDMEKKFGEAANDPQFFRDFFETASNSIDVVYTDDVFDKLYDMINDFESKEEFYESLQSVFD